MSELQNVHLVNCCCRVESLQIVQVRVHSRQSYLSGSVPKLCAQACAQLHAELSHSYVRMVFVVASGRSFGRT